MSPSRNLPALPDPGNNLWSKDLDHNSSGACVLTMAAGGDVLALFSLFTLPTYTTWWYDWFDLWLGDNTEYDDDDKDDTKLVCEVTLHHNSCLVLCWGWRSGQLQQWCTGCSSNHGNDSDQLCRVFHQWWSWSRPVDQEWCEDDISSASGIQKMVAMTI